MSGIMMSRMMRSGVSSLRRARASLALSARTTSWPEPERRTSRRYRIPGSSSTTKSLATSSMV
jgi:hypothetical protein